MAQSNNLAGMVDGCLSLVALSPPSFAFDFVILYPLSFGEEQFPPKVKKKLLLIIPDWQADEFGSDLYFRVSVILPLMYVEEGQSVRKRCFVPLSRECFVVKISLSTEIRHHYFCHPTSYLHYYILLI